MNSIMQDPKTVSVSGDVKDLLAQIDEGISALNTRRPFSPEIDYKIRKTFLPDRITATLNIEGIGVTRRQTLSIMDAMTIAGNSSREDREILNALRADEFVYEFASDGSDIDLAFIRQINGMILDGTKDQAGEFRKQNVQISGAKFSPPDHCEVYPLMQSVCDAFPSSAYLHPVLQSAWLHQQFTCVHPFIDGNGRTGRLLQDYCLLKRGLFPVGIPSSQRDDYYNALQKADEGNWDDLVEIIAMAELSVINKIEAITKEPENRARWITNLAKAASAKKTGSLHKQYLVWRQRMHLIMEAFYTAARDIDEQADDIGVEFRDYDIIDFEKWKQIQSYGKADRTWFFSMIFFADGQAFYKTIAYFRRHKVDREDPLVDARDIVSLCFTGQEARDPNPPNFASYNDPHVRVRELLYYEDQLHAYYQQIPSNSRQCLDHESVDLVVQDFFEDMFYRKAGVAD